MKKILLSVCAAAIVALAVINLNLVLNSEYDIDFTLASIVSLANGENPENEGGYQGATEVIDVDCETQFYYTCDLGSKSGCDMGYMFCYLHCRGACSCCPYESLTRLTCRKLI